MSFLRSFGRFIGLNTTPSGASPAPVPSSAAPPPPAPPPPPPPSAPSTLPTRPARPARPAPSISPTTLPIRSRSNEFQPSIVVVNPAVPPVEELNPRGRSTKRQTSKKRTTPRRHSRRPPRTITARAPKIVTPTTKTAMVRERKHRVYERQRAKQREMDGVLRTPATYWRVLRSGRKHRSFGGVRAR